MPQPFYTGEFYPQHTAMGIRKTVGGWMAKAATTIAGSSASPFYSLTDPRLGRLFSGFGSMSPTLISVGSAVDIAKAWQDCPPLVAIICAKANADIRGKVVFKKAGTDEVITEKSRQPQAKAMQKLMDKPNPLQTWRQFRAQQKIYTQIFGFCPVLAVKPVGFTDAASVKALWNLPPQYIKIETTGKLFYQSDSGGIIKKITISYGGRETELPVADIFILKDQYVSLNQEIVPSSRISALQYPISNITVAYRGSNVLITKHGALGILSNAGKDAAGATPVTPKQKEDLQADLQKYGLSEDQWQVIITTASLSWQQIALPIKDLMLFETIAEGTMQCCSVYGYPYELLPKTVNDKFTNKAEAKKSLYEDVIIPEADMDMEVYNEYFKLGESGVEMVLDYGHLEVFQVKALDKANADKAQAEAGQIKFTNNIITLNRMREMLGEPTVPGDDIYYDEWSQRKADAANLNPDGTTNQKAGADPAAEADPANS